MVAPGRPFKARIWPSLVVRNNTLTVPLMVDTFERYAGAPSAMLGRSTCTIRCSDTKLNVLITLSWVLLLLWRELRPNCGQSYAERATARAAAKASVQNARGLCRGSKRLMSTCFLVWARHCPHLKRNR